MIVKATVNGFRLKLSADNEARSELAHIVREYGDARAESFIAEALHERWEFVRPEEVGALTSAPILAECDGIVRDEADGSLVECGRVAWFPDYCIRDPWQELARTGRVVFAIAADESAKAAA